MRRTLAVAGVVGIVALGSATWVLAQSGPVSQGNADPEIASIEPLPGTVLLNGATELMPELARRLEAWATRFEVERMTVAELVAGIDSLTKAVVSLEETEDEWLRTRELLMRRTALCELLPVEHEYRGGEYCS